MLGLLNWVSMIFEGIAYVFGVGFLGVTDIYELKCEFGMMDEEWEYVKIVFEVEVVRYEMDDVEMG